MTEEATLYDYWQALYRRRRAILIVTLSSTLFAYIISLILPPVYEASATFYMPITNSTPLYTVSGSPTQVDRTPLMPVAEEKAAGAHLGILKGGEIAAEVLKRFPNKTSRDLELDVDFVLNEYFLTEVYVRDEDPVEAAAIANFYTTAYRDFHRRSISRRSDQHVLALEKQIEATEQMLSENLNAQQRERDRNLSNSVTTETLQMEYRRLTDLLGSMRANLVESRLEAENPGVELVVSESALVPKLPAFPRPILNSVVALILGLAVGCYYALLLEYLSRLRRFVINRDMDITPLDDRIMDEAERS